MLAFGSSVAVSYLGLPKKFSEVDFSISTFDDFLLLLYDVGRFNLSLGSQVVCLDVNKQATTQKQWNIVALSLAEIGDIERFNDNPKEALKWLNQSNEIIMHKQNGNVASIRYLTYKEKLYRDL